ncbi:hypothetical protein Tco_0069884 [Tanacetum coccineum]
MSTLVFVDPEISTQAYGAQSSRVPVPLPEDPYEATRTTRMAVRVPPAMSPGLSASMAEVEAMSDLVFLEEEEDGEIEESSDSDSVSADAEDEGPTVKDEDPAAGNEGLAAGDKGPDMGVEILSLGGDEFVPEGQPRAAPVVETAMGEPLGLGYRALRRREIALGEGRMPSVFEIDLEDGIAYIDVPAYPPPAPPAQTLPSPEWSSGLLPISLAPSIVPSPI